MEFKEAYEIVSKFNSVYDYCTERTDAFVFGKKGENCFDGTNSPVALMKNNASCINFVVYMSSSKGELVREGFIADWLAGNIE